MSTASVGTASQNGICQMRELIALFLPVRHRMFASSIEAERAIFDPNCSLKEYQDALDFLYRSSR